MFSSIRTSEKNKEIVSQLTRKLNLGAENIVARLALCYSLSLDHKMNLADIQDSKGKEYSRKILFGEYDVHYIALVCVHYDLYRTHKDIGKYIKMHIDEGLERMFSDIPSNPSIDFLYRTINNL